MEDNQSPFHDDQVHKYLVSNFMPLLKGVVSKMLKSGRIPKDLVETDDPHEAFLNLYEPAVHGLMKAIHTYNPEELSAFTGKPRSFQSHAWKVITGIISDHVKHKDIPRTDAAMASRVAKDKKQENMELHERHKELARQFEAVGDVVNANVHKRKALDHLQESQAVKVKGGGIGRDVVEGLGGEMDEEGGGFGGVGQVRNPVGEFANRLDNEAKAKIQAKVDKKEAQIAARQKQNEQVVQPPVGQQVSQQAHQQTQQAPQEPVKPKLIIRRMAKPEQLERMDRIDSAKQGTKKPE
jgi:hypothetical protein